MTILGRRVVGVQLRRKANSWRSGAGVQWEPATRAAEAGRAGSRGKGRVCGIQVVFLVQTVASKRAERARGRSRRLPLQRVS